MYVMSIKKTLSQLFQTIDLSPFTVYNHVFNHLRKNNIFTEHQSGFLPHDSTVCQLSYLYHTFSEAFDHGKDNSCYFCVM